MEGGVIINKIYVNRYMPKNFFETNKGITDAPSTSELLAKNIMIVALELNQDEVIRGISELDQPDWIVNGNGYEVTFSVSADEVKDYKSRNQRISTNIETQIIENIKYSLEKKRRRSRPYSIKPTIILICIQPLFYWYEEAYTHRNIGPSQLRRDIFFTEIYNKYISAGFYENILILQLNEKKEYSLFDIKEFYYGRNYLKCIGINDFSALPYCETTSHKVDYEDSAIKYEINDISRNCITNET